MNINKKIVIGLTLSFFLKKGVINIKKLFIGIGVLSLILIIASKVNIASAAREIITNVFITNTASNPVPVTVQNFASPNPSINPSNQTKVVNVFDETFNSYEVKVSDYINVDGYRKVVLYLEATQYNFANAIGRYYIEQGPNDGMIGGGPNVSLSGNGWRNYHSSDVLGRYIQVRVANSEQVDNLKVRLYLIP